MILNKLPQNILETLKICSETADNIKIYLVVNASKFETRDKESILEYIEFNSGENRKPWKKISGLISNTHLGDETTKEDAIRGYDILKEVQTKTSIPIVAISIDEKLKNEFTSTYDNVPVRILNRHMPKAFW